MANVYAFPHDGTAEGDCALGGLHAIPFPNKRAVTLRAIQNKFASHLIDDDDGYDEDEREYLDDEISDMKGAYVVSEEDYNRIQTVIGCLPEAGGDSACYEQQATIKAMYKAFSIKTLGKVMKVRKSRY